MDAHSADQFGEHRDYWWNFDFLELMSRRWRLSDASSLADIGCGVGHWSRLLFRHLRPGSRLVGFDREPEWVRQARANFANTFPNVGPGEVEFLEGDASYVPLPNDSFDVVTCQTLLIHLADPRKALKEMVRVARPGGLIICVEPNNLFNILGFTSTTERQSVRELVRSFEFWLRYQRGKIALGQGNHSLGDLVPGLFRETGLYDIKVYQSDKTSPVYPPYNKPEERAILEQANEWKESSTGLWNLRDIRQAVLAGGGTEEFIEVSWAEFQRAFEEEQRAIHDGQFHAAGGRIVYLVSGRKAVNP